MKVKNQISPPRWATQLLHWYCKPELVEDLEGDLYECFQRNTISRGRRSATLIYIIDVIKFFRLYTIRKPEFVNILINWIMLGSYIKTSGRNLVRNKLFSSINIIGLAVSMSVGLLMISFLNDLFSYDRFHEKGDRIFRVISHPYFKGEQNLNEYATTSIKTGKLIQEKLTGVEDITTLRSGFSGDASVGENTLPVTALYADNSFFKVFTFPLISGNAENALREPYSVVLTEKTSTKLFGDSEALGRSVRFDTVDYVVTAVMKDVPFFSHIQFESLISFSTVELQQKQERNFLSWTNMWDNYVYLTTTKNTDLSLLQSNLNQLCKEENKAFDHTKIFLELQPLQSIVLGKHLARNHGPLLSEVSIGFSTGIVWVIGGLSLIVILSACFNYTNLSIARSLRRSKEVGIRKVIGALKSHVLGQFLSEAIIVSLMALAIAIIIFVLLRPFVFSMVPELERIVQLNVSASIIAYSLLFAIAVGFLAGFLLAIFFSRIQASQVLKDISALKVFRHVGMRKALIVVQYTFSLIFITATFIGLKQYKSFLSFDLGFQTENVLNIKLQKNKAELLLKELSEIPEVEAASQSFLITSVGNYWGGYLKYLDPQDSGLIWSNKVNEKYIPLHHYELLAGRNFSVKADSTEGEVIVSEQVLKRFGIGNGRPEDALGEIVTFTNPAEQNIKLTIIGVMKDFHYGKMDNLIEPVIFRSLGKQPAHYVNVKISTTDLPSAMTKIEDAWKKIDKVHPMEASFYDEQIEQAYSEFSSMIKIIGFLAFLAVSIASLGLLGMVVFTTETKLKEVSIRKTLGAGEGSLVFLLSKGFIFLLTLSAVIALPVAYLFFDRVVLQRFPYHSPIGTEVIFGFLIVMGIALLIIGFLTLGIARTNPAQVLKNE